MAGKWFYEKKNFVAIMKKFFVATIFFASIMGWFCRNNLRFCRNNGFREEISNQLSRCYIIKCIFSNKSNNFRNQRLWQRECRSNKNHLQPRDTKVDTMMIIALNEKNFVTIMVSISLRLRLPGLSNSTRVRYFGIIYAL